jgi:hypothetical protein
MYQAVHVYSNSQFHSLRWKLNLPAQITQNNDVKIHKTKTLLILTSFFCTQRKRPINRLIYKLAFRICVLYWDGILIYTQAASTCCIFGFINHRLHDLNFESDTKFNRYIIQETKLAVTLVCIQFTTLDEGWWDLRSDSLHESWWELRSESLHESWWKLRSESLHESWWELIWEARVCMRVDESREERVCMRVFSTFVLQSKENKSCARVDES